jgi:hypothetical protein
VGVFFAPMITSRKYTMADYKLYTLVDITHTGQYRPGMSGNILHKKEQNFNTVIQTLGLRANIYYTRSPIALDIKGSLIGFNTDQLIRVWRFDFKTETESAYEYNGNPVGLLEHDFHLVPYISGLDELMNQQYAVFVTEGKGKNIVFHFRG